MPRKKDLPPPSPEEEVAELKGLMDEQEGMAEESARSDPRKLSAVWIAKGDHLVLLVTKAVGLKAKKTRYTCRILTVDSDL